MPARLIASQVTMVPKSEGDLSFRLPPYLPIAVRTALRTTTSWTPFINTSSNGSTHSRCVNERTRAMRASGRKLTKCDRLESGGPESELVHSVRPLRMLFTDRCSAIGMPKPGKYKWVANEKNLGRTECLPSKKQNCETNPSRMRWVRFANCGGARVSRQMRRQRGRE